jgi:hypothetical protein
MNSQHLRAFLWLRWRLRVNQWRRGGIANSVLLVLRLVLGVGFAIALFIVFLLIGCFMLADSSPTVLMYFWDGLILGFLFLWTTGLVADLQRAEALSLNNSCTCLFHSAGYSSSTTSAPCRAFTSSFSCLRWLAPAWD